MFSAKRYDRELLAAANVEAGHELVFFDAPLDASIIRDDVIQRLVSFLK